RAVDGARNLADQDNVAGSVIGVGRGGAIQVDRVSGGIEVGPAEGGREAGRRRYQGGHTEADYGKGGGASQAGGKRVVDRKTLAARGVQRGRESFGAAGQCAVSG